MAWSRHMPASAPEIPLLYPSLLVISNNLTDNHFHPRKYFRQPIKTQFACKVGHEDYFVFRHSVINQDLNGHESSTAARHLWVEEENTVVRTNVRW